MTHKNIYTKFMIEYDKASVTSSYPSLTKYEVATLLDKAYNALIAQKVTGNNIRRSSFESDIKAISDLQNLISTSTINLSSADVSSNVKKAQLTPDFLYFVEARVKNDNSSFIRNTQIIDHNSAKKFFVTENNLPWIVTPACYIQSDYLYIVYDPKDANNITKVSMEYIKKPTSFVSGSNTTTLDSDTPFECNDTIANELINLAIVFALENVESQRLTSKLNTRGLES